MTNLRRDDKIVLTSVGGNTFNVENRDGLVFEANDDFFIYFKNVNFKKDGTIDGRYLGDANDSMIDGYCRNADFGTDGWTIDGKQIKTARLVAVNNKSGAIVIIQN
jgi:hypothetical protein